PNLREGSPPLRPVEDNDIVHRRMLPDQHARPRLQQPRDVRAWCMALDGVDDGQHVHGVAHGTHHDYEYLVQSCGSDGHVSSTSAESRARCSLVIGAPFRCRQRSIECTSRRRLPRAARRLFTRLTLSTSSTHAVNDAPPSARSTFFTFRSGWCAPARASESRRMPVESSAASSSAPPSMQTDPRSRAPGTSAVTTSDLRSRGPAG